MSLKTDKFFFNALKASRKVNRLTSGRIFNTNRATEDDRLDKVPYCVITFDSLVNDTEALTKDDIESGEDNVSVSILCVAASREKLADLTQAVRLASITRWRANNDEDAPISWTFSAGEVMCDIQKPCLYQTLTYNCVTDSDIEIVY